jgi:hypothetical protein
MCLVSAAACGSADSAEWIGSWWPAGACQQEQAKSWQTTIAGTWFYFAKGRFDGRLQEIRLAADFVHVRMCKLGSWLPLKCF